MKDSKYLERFKAIDETLKEQAPLSGDFLIVERIADEELKTKSGIVIPVMGARQINTLTSDRPNWVRVLEVGAGYYSQETDPDTGIITEKTIPLDVCVGDIVLVSQISVKYFSVYGELEGYEADSIGITKESEIQRRFKGQEAYDRYFGRLNQPATQAVVKQ